MKYREAIARALIDSMSGDSKVLIMGESVTDPKGIFGTTLEAATKFPVRVIEAPVSENMLTGACLGLALEGWKPIFVHARCEFLMPAMEQLVNSAAKWRYVHHRPLTMVARGLVGRGWGQGPNHSQAFHAMFAQLPGLRVLYPVHPSGISHWLEEALTCGWPTMILEPRRLYEVAAIEYPLWDQPDVFLVTFGDIVLDAAAAAYQLQEAGVKAQVFPIEDVTAMALPETDVPVVVADTGHLFCGAAAEAVARLAEGGNSKFRRVGPPFIPLPTSRPLEQLWYPSAQDILRAVSELLDIATLEAQPFTAADEGFVGPF